MFSVNSSPTVVNNTLCSNEAAYVGGIYCIAGAPAIANCILWANGDGLFGCSATFSCIEDGDAGTGNIATDPRLLGANGGLGPDGIAGTGDDDYRLGARSPCIDVAQWGAGAPETDMDGNPRHDDLGMPNGPQAGSPPKDMGALERQADSGPAAVLAAAAQLQGYIGSPGATLTLRFAFTDAAGALLARREVDVAYSNGRDTETVVLDDVPGDTARVSCKETQHFLRSRVDIAGAAPDLTADFTGDNMLLGGDLKDDNFVDVFDFALFLANFGRMDAPECDINGDGIVDIVEFTYIRLHFFQEGDPE
jgi:hypothetical protein